MKLQLSLLVLSFFQLAQALTSASIPKQGELCPLGKCANGLTCHAEPCPMGVTCERIGLPERCYPTQTAPKGSPCAGPDKIKCKGNLKCAMPRGQCRAMMDKCVLQFGECVEETSASIPTSTVSPTQTTSTVSPTQTTRIVTDSCPGFPGCPDITTSTMEPNQTSSVVYPTDIVVGAASGITAFSFAGMIALFL